MVLSPYFQLNKIKTTEILKIKKTSEAREKGADHLRPDCIFNQHAFHHVPPFIFLEDE